MIAVGAIGWSLFGRLPASGGTPSRDIPVPPVVTLAAPTTTTEPVYAFKGCGIKHTSRANIAP